MVLLLPRWDFKWGQGWCLLRIWSAWGSTQAVCSGMCSVSPALVLEPPLEALTRGPEDHQTLFLQVEASKTRRWKSQVKSEERLEAV